MNFTHSKTPVQSHTCTDEELGLAESDGAKPHLFPLAKGEMNMESIFGEKICIDEQDLRLYGSFNGARTRRLTLNVLTCSGHDYCLDHNLAKNRLKGNYIALITNRIRFDSNLYGADSILTESKIDWLPIATQV